MRYLVVLVVANLFAFSATAQNFVVEQSVPEAGQADVALSDTVAFSFNGRVSIGTNWNTAFVQEPREALDISRVSLCLTFLDQCDAGDDIPRHVRFRVSHRPETDYTWLVYSVESVAGTAMTEPYVLRYTTASNRGKGRVQGTLASPTARQKTRMAPAVRASLRQLVSGLQRSSLGRPVFDRVQTMGSIGPRTGAEKTRPGTQFNVVADKAAEGPFTQILLVEEFSIQERAWSIRGADVLIGSSGSYLIDFVRPGTYVPIAVRYTDGTNSEIDALGFHDPDGDGTPNAVTVDGDEQTGVSLQLFEFPLTTARAGANLQTAIDSAASYAPDQELRRIQPGPGMRPSGMAYGWTYRFVSPATDLETRVVINPLEVRVDTLPAAGFIEEMRPLPDRFIDSDEALQIALNDGGQDLIDSFQPRSISTNLDGGNLFWTDAPIPEEEFWRVRIVAATSTRTQIFERYINMETGEFLPVELTAFTATVDRGAVALRWTTAGETHNAGFEVQHAPGPPVRSDSWSTLGFVEGAGTTQEPQAYRFQTADLEPGAHRFRLRQIDTDGTAHLSDVVQATVQMNAAPRLTAPAPNPTRGAATVRFGLESSQPATVALYDLLGRKRATLYEGTPAAHQMQTVRVETDRLPSGIYFVRLTAGAQTLTRRLTIVK